VLKRHSNYVQTGDHYISIMYISVFLLSLDWLCSWTCIVSCSEGRNMLVSTVITFMLSKDVMTTCM